eukprot:5897295-Pleurochrysis_carterae.AAC.3
MHACKYVGYFGSDVCMHVSICSLASMCAPGCRHAPEVENAVKRGAPRGKGRLDLVEKFRSVHVAFPKCPKRTRVSADTHRLK